MKYDCTMIGRKNSQKNDRPFKEVLNEVLPPKDIMEGDDYLHALREAVCKQPAADRNLLVLYSELGSFRKIAVRFGVTHSTISKQIRRIQGNVRRDLAAAIGRTRR